MDFKDIVDSDINILFLDYNPVNCAKMHGDEDVIIQCIINMQLLMNAHHMHNSDRKGELLPPRFIEHACSKWVCQSKGNYFWLMAQTAAFIEERAPRELVMSFEMRHIENFIFPILRHLPPIPHVQVSMPPILVPSANVVAGNPIESYRNYYFDRLVKRDNRILIADDYIGRWWSRSEVPQWFDVICRQKLKETLVADREFYKTERIAEKKRDKEHSEIFGDDDDSEDDKLRRLGFVDDHDEEGFDEPTLPSDDEVDKMSFEEVYDEMERAGIVEDSFSDEAEEYDRDLVKTMIHEALHSKEREWVFTDCPKCDWRKPGNHAPGNCPSCGTKLVEGPKPIIPDNGEPLGVYEMIFLDNDDAFVAYMIIAAHNTSQAKYYGLAQSRWCSDDPPPVYTVPKRMTRLISLPGEEGVINAYYNE